MLVSVPSVRRGLSWSVALAALWVVLALLRSGTTFHLAPFLVAAIAAIVLATDSDREPVIHEVLGASAAAIVVGIAATLILAAADSMTGPSLLPFGGAVTEAFVFVAVGGVAGPILALALNRRRG